VRLRCFLALHPDALWKYTVSDLGRELGVSRPMVHVLLPNWTKRRKHLQIERIRSFALEHPKARLFDANERIPWPQIAEDIGLSVKLVKQGWLALGLPIEDRLEREVVKERCAQRQRRLLQTVIREETCVVCGAAFPWTKMHERGRRREGRSLSCSRSCGQKVRFEQRDRALTSPNTHHLRPVRDARPRATTGTMTSLVLL
jgi:hypothetical protein